MLRRHKFLACPGQPNNWHAGNNTRTHTYRPTAADTMSKKNNKHTRANRRTFDLEREKREAEAKMLKLQKKAMKPEAGKKVKGVRVRKGVVIKGIKVVDSDSKKKVVRILKKRAAAKAASAMAVDRPKKSAKGPAAASRREAGAMDAMDTAA